MEDDAKLARVIQDQINEILYQYWDPIGLSCALPKDEYSRYVGPIYRALSSGASESEIVRLLDELESNIGCKAPEERKHVAARKLRAVELAIEMRGTRK